MWARCSIQRRANETDGQLPRGFGDAAGRRRPIKTPPPFGFFFGFRSLTFALFVFALLFFAPVFLAPLFLLLAVLFITRGLVIDRPQRMIESVRFNQAYILQPIAFGDATTANITR